MPIWTRTYPIPAAQLVENRIRELYPTIDISLSTEPVDGINKVNYISIPDLPQTEFDSLIQSLIVDYPEAMVDDVKQEIPFHITDSAAQTWTNMPAAITEFRGLTLFRCYTNLGVRTEGQLQVNVIVPGAIGAELRMQCSIDNGSTWRTLGAIGTPGPSAAIDTVGTIKGPWANIGPAVRKEVLLRLIGIGGNGTADPQFGEISLRVR
jgi:hypothetical protein